MMDKEEFQRKIDQLDAEISVLRETAKKLSGEIEVLLQRIKERSANECSPNQTVDSA